MFSCEVTNPTHVDENVSRREQSQQHDNVYLKELLEVYRDQIGTLKLALNSKNEIVSDLIQCIQVNNITTVTSSNEVSVGEATKSPCVVKLDKSVVKIDQRVNQWTLFKVQLLPVVTLSNSDKTHAYSNFTCNS